MSACFQIASLGVDHAANLHKAERFCRRAKDLDVDLALFPEMWNVGYTLQRDDPDGPDAWNHGRSSSTILFIPRCRARPRAEDGPRDYVPGAGEEGPRNSVAVIDRRGDVVLTYSNVHTCDFDKEACLAPGDGFRVGTLDLAEGSVVLSARVECLDRPHNLQPNVDGSASDRHSILSPDGRSALRDIQTVRATPRNQRSATDIRASAVGTVGMRTRGGRVPVSPRTLELDALVVGAGPTGLTLAGQLAAMGTRVRLIDRGADRAHESRALAVQPRTLEVLRGLGAADELVARGNPTVRLELRAGGRQTRLRMFDIGVTDTAYPFLLLLSQAEIEQVLIDALASRGVGVERPVELIGLDQHEAGVRCSLRREDGAIETVDARYVIGCDGAHSTVRHLASIAFVGSAYAPKFALGDVEVDGDLDPDVAYAYLGRGGILLFFPLRRPTTWRVIGMLPPSREHRDSNSGSDALMLSELQDVVKRFTGDPLRLRDPAWLTKFGLAHRQAVRYRAGRVFLAGDAAHVHSPAGAQGMNTGIQDAWNLGWKLALACAGTADPALLDTYHEERWPVGRSVLRLSDRAFAAGTSTNAAAGLIRSEIVPRLLPLLAGFPFVRAAAFRTISELGIRYRGSSTIAEGRPPLVRGPRPGDRLPDAEVTFDGERRWLQQLISAPRFHLLLCGRREAWDEADLSRVMNRQPGVVSAYRLTSEPTAGAIHDDRGQAFARLGVDDVAEYVVRPDGYVGFRARSTALPQVAAYLERWLPGSEAA